MPDRSRVRNLVLFLSLAALCAARAPARAAAAEPTGAPALDALLAEAECASPALLAARARAAALAHVAPRASALPDPWLTVGLANESFTDWTVGEAEMAGISLTFEQEVPLSAKRALIGRQAEVEAGVALEREHALRLDLRARIKTAYASLYRIDQTLAVLAASRALVDGFEATARSHYASGHGRLDTVLRAQAEQTRLEADVARYEAERRATLALLNTLAGRAPDRSLEPVLDLPRSPLPAPAGTIAERLEVAPELAVRTREQQGAEVALALSRQEGRSDLMLMGRYVNRNPLAPVFELGLGVRLPLWRERKQGNAVLESTELAAAATAEVAAARLELLAMLHEKLAEVERADRLLVLYDQGLLEQSRAALEAATAAYASGGAEFDAVAEAFAAHLRYRLDRIAEAAAREAAVARIEALTGGGQ